jgi:hypothetical protein
MTPEGQFLYSQKTATGPYPKPIESSPYSYTLFMIHFNIILPSMPRSSKRSSFWVFRDPVCMSPVPVTCLKSWNSLSRFLHPVIYCLLCSHILFSILSSNSKYMFFPEGTRPVLYQHKTMGKIIVGYFLICKFLCRRQVTQDFELNGNGRSPNLTCCKPLVSIIWFAPVISKYFT